MTVVTAQDLRNEMVRTQVVARGVVDPRVLTAMREVPREIGRAHV